MTNASRWPIFVPVVIACLATQALAGMPALLPDDLPTRLKLHDSAVERLTAISFFLSGVFLCSLAVCLLWNYLQRDFTWLPRLTVLKSLALVVLSQYYPVLRRLRRLSLVLLARCDSSRYSSS